MTTDDPRVPADLVPTAALAWYDATGRGLAFRATSDPNAVLVSELMIQQTHAARVAMGGREIRGSPASSRVASSMTSAIEARLSVGPRRPPRFLQGGSLQPAPG